MLTCSGRVNLGKDATRRLPLGGVSTSPIVGCPSLAFFKAYFIPMLMNTAQRNKTVGPTVMATIQIESLPDIPIHRSNWRKMNKEKKWS